MLAMATMFPLQPLQADPEIVDLSLVLPSYLNGGYEPQIIQGNICYYATINL